MIELINVKLPLEAALEGGDELILSALLKETGLKAHELRTYSLRKRALDARKKHELSFVASFILDAPSKEAKLLAQNKNVRDFDEQVYKPQSSAHCKKAALKLLPGINSEARPIVVGAGCAGLFCALSLAQAGLRPLVLERGKASKERTQDIDQFIQTAQLNTQSNIQFGLGGAGTFSDGKLTTNTKSIYHRYILDALVRAGAPQEISYLAKPHIGSDILPGVVEHLVKEIEQAGGEFHFNTQFIGFENSSLSSDILKIVTKNSISGAEQEFFATQIFLACGHSARDTFKYLADKKLALEPKTFSMGFRIEHKQTHINEQQYGAFASHPALGAADYKLVHHLKNGRSAYSFCMCPGGTVVAAASEQNSVCTNGMSEYARNKENANAGFLVAVNPSDLNPNNILAGIELQRRCEHKAFIQAGSTYKAPAQLVGDFLENKSSKGAGSVIPSYPLGVHWTCMNELLPAYIIDCLKQSLPALGKKLPGFDDPEAVLTGVETRSSSPLRILRDKESCRSISHPLITPCGEGAGYAGGIMSAAADGVRCAEAFMQLHA